MNARLPFLLNVRRGLARHASVPSWTPRVRVDSSVADPHVGAAELNALSTASWRSGELGRAIALQERAIRIKEQRGDEDLDQYKEELDAMKAGDPAPPE